MLTAARSALMLITKTCERYVSSVISENDMRSGIINARLIGKIVVRSVLFSIQTIYIIKLMRVGADLPKMTVHHISNGHFRRFMYPK